MKSNFKFVVLALPAAAMALAAGCQAKFPPVGAYSAPVTTPNYSLVANFEGNLNPTPEPTNQTNSHLFEVREPNNQVVWPGLWEVVNNFPGYETATGTIEGPGADNTKLAFHVTGSVTDKGDGTYPGVELDGYLDSASGNPNGAYNMSFFTGVKFWINITTNDTATFREFYITTVQESPPPTGTCSALTGCYNYFGYQFPGTTNGWKQYSFSFTSLITSFGIIPNPPTFTGINLQQVLGMLWEEGRSNQAGTANVDFWVDEVYFY